MQIIALLSGRVNLNAREEDYLKYASFVLSMALLKLFWNYFDIWLRRHCTYFFCPFSYLCPPIFLPAVPSHSPTEVGTCRRGGGGWQRCFQNPCPGGSPPSSYTLVSFSLEQWGEVSSGNPCYSAVSLPMRCTLSMCYRIEGL